MWLSKAGNYVISDCVCLLCEFFKWKMVQKMPFSGWRKTSPEKNVSMNLSLSFSVGELFIHGCKCLSNDLLEVLNNMHFFIKVMKALFVFLWLLMYFHSFHCCNTHITERIMCALVLIQWFDSSLCVKYKNWRAGTIQIGQDSLSSFGKASYVLCCTNYLCPNLQFHSAMLRISLIASVTH